MRRADPHHFLHLLRTRRGAWALSWCCKRSNQQLHQVGEHSSPLPSCQGWELQRNTTRNQHEHYNDVNTKSIIEEKPRKQQKMQAIYADIDAVLMDRD